MKKILVTGGAGYIGSALIPYLLAAGYQVKALDCLRFGGEGLLGVWAHPHFEFIGGTITDPKHRKEALHDVDSVIHLAALVGDPMCKQDPALARQVNLDATLALMDESIRARVRNFTFVSTCSNYGISRANELATEDSALNPISLYAETKVAAERHLLKLATKTFAPTVLRLATVYGVSPRMRFDLTVNEFARDAALEKKLVVFGERNWRPYVYVHDVAGAILQVLKSPVADRTGQVFNVGHTEENYQKLTLCRLLQKRLPKTNVEFVKTGPDPRSYKVSFDKIRRVLKYVPRHRVPQGIDEVIHLVRAGIIQDLNSARWRNT